MRHPAILLCTLLASVSCGQDWNIDKPETKDLNGNQTINSVNLTKDGNLTLNSSGTNTINKMTMFSFNDGAGAKFNANSGTLKLDLMMTNINHRSNSVDFTLKNGSTLELIGGQNGWGTGVFQGINTTLTATLETGSTFKGNLSNDGSSTITINQGSTFKGNIKQSGGKLTARVEGKLEGSIISTHKTKESSLWANDKTNVTGQTATITGDIVQEGGTLTGVNKGLGLQGSFIQSGGKSDIAFHTSIFNNTTTISGGQSLLYFYDTKLKAISTTGGINTIHLKGHQDTHANGSHMEGYTGVDSFTTLTLGEKSSMQGASQTRGALILASEDSTIKGSVTGNDAALNITLKSSTLQGSITNNGGETQVLAQDKSLIQDSITQTGGLLKVILENSDIGGNISQTRGELSKIKVTNGSIKNGVHLIGVSNKNPRDDMLLSGATIDKGLRLENLAVIFMVTASNGTTINGGYHQIGGAKVIVNYDRSIINDGVHVRDGNRPDFMTLLNLSNSQINGNITSTNHTIKTMLSNSTAGDRITITGGSGYFQGSDRSIYKGDLISNDTDTTELHLSTDSKLEGNVKQNKGNQEITLEERSIITGFITNNETNSLIALDTNSELLGSLTQNKGKLTLGLGGGSIIHGSVLLEQAQTTLNNGKTRQPHGTIKGNLTQNGGSLDGGIGGLTLEGFFTQTGGTSHITFWSANFHNHTHIKNAISTKITFDDRSKLKSYTIEDSKGDNLLKLDRETILDGDFLLDRSSAKLSIHNDSKITGSVISKDAGNKLELDMQTGGTIGGNLEIENSEVGGMVNGGTIGGNINIKNATKAEIGFLDSKVGGNIYIYKGTNAINLNNTQVGGWFKMEGKGPSNPTLKLHFANGSSIGSDMSFIDTDVWFGGKGNQSTVHGNLISTNSTLTNGQMGVGGWDENANNGLIIQKDFKQTNGTLDLLFKNKSQIHGITIIDNPDKFHLTLDRSSLKEFQITGGTDNFLTLQDTSRQTGNSTLTDTKITIKATGNSTITGDITATSKDKTKPSLTTLDFDRSTLIGSISQDNGTLDISAKNKSTLTGGITTTDLERLSLTLDHSNRIGSISAVDNKAITIKLLNGSTMHSDLTSTSNESILIDIKGGSTLGGNITHSSGGKTKEFKITLSEGSTLDNIKTDLNGHLDIIAKDSTLNSQEIKIVTGSLSLKLDHSFGVIGKMSTGGSNSINILTTNNSDSRIDEIALNDQANLNLTAKGGAVMQGRLTLDEDAKAVLSSFENANLKFDITPTNRADLKIALNGGRLQGKITQQDPLLGEATLGSAGGFGGRWIMSDSSTLRSLTIDNSAADVGNKALMLTDSSRSSISMVDMTKDELGNSRIGRAMVGKAPQAGQTLPKTLRLSTLNGNNGVFRVYTDIGANLSDKLTTQTAQGHHIMQVYYNPKTFTTDLTGKHIIIAHVDDNKTTANFEGGYTETGNQTYKTELSKVAAQGGGWDWILGGTQDLGPSHSTKVIASILQSQYRSFSIQNESLETRLGELRDLKRIHGLWARYNMGVNETLETSSHLKLHDRFYSTWLGYDENSLSLKGQNFIGFALNYTLITPESEEYKGQIHNIGFNFYDTFIAKNDFYFDIVAKYILSYGDYDISYYTLEGNAPKYVNHKFMVSLEIGKPFRLTQQRNNYFYLEPQGQITSGYIHSNELEVIDVTNTKIKADIGHTFPVIMRAGLVAGYSIRSYTFRADFRFGTSLLYEMRTGGDVHLNDGHSIITYRYPSNFNLLLHAGSNIVLNDASRIYLQASTGLFGSTHTNYAINAGVRFNFGPKNTRRLKVPSYSPPPPPPKPDYDPRNVETITDFSKEDIRQNKEGMRKGPYEDYFINTRKSFRDTTSFNKGSR